MSDKLKKASIAAGALAAASGMAGAAEKEAVDGLIAKLRDKNDNVRANGLLNAVEVGAPAVKPLAKLMENDDIEVSRAGKRALWKIVRNVGRPGAGDERKSLEALKDGLKSAAMDFRPNIAQSLRQRGVMVRRPAPVKLVPTKETNVQPLKG